jgi:hypothetical protein
MVKTTFATLGSKRKVRKMVEKKLPKVIENPKKMLIISGRKTSNIIKESLVDFVSIYFHYNLSCIFMYILHIYTDKMSHVLIHSFIYTAYMPTFIHIIFESIYK